MRTTVLSNLVTVTCVMSLSVTIASAGCTTPPAAEQAPRAAVSIVESQRDYADVNGLRMYYEIHGSGRPLVLLHGAFGVAESWAPMLPALTGVDAHNAR